MKLKNKKLFLLDIDGTVCKGENLIDGASDFLYKVRENNGDFVFITNNATKSTNDYINQFKKLGISTNEKNFITAGYATIQYLKENYKDKLIYVLASKSFITELKQNNIKITDDYNNKNIKCVLISYDNELTYDKLSGACKLLLNKNVDYLATNPDLVCPVEFGYLPDCGAICQMIEHAVKRKPYFIGKPEAAIIDLAIKNNNYTKQDALIVGDRIYTDIMCGHRSGVDTALVLTGEATTEDVEKSEIKPNYIFNSLSELGEIYSDA